jgi:outer membrane lipoprotein-sorting protein
VYTLRRLPLSRLLLLCGLVLAIGIFATALALAVSAGPTPPQRPLATAVHDALEGPAVAGVSAEVTLTDNLLEGANLAGGEHGGLTSSPLVKGGSGRLWISNDGRVRLELQSEQGDTEVTYDGHTLVVYDAASNTAYRYTPKQQGTTGAGSGSDHGSRHAPSVAQIEEAIAKVDKHATLSGAKPTDVAGAPAYTVRLSPSESGSLIGGAELSFDAENGIPLRTAVYSSQSSSPVIELAATKVSFGPIAAGVFDISPPPSAKVQEIQLREGGSESTHKGTGEKPNVTVHGHGVTGIVVLEAKSHGKSGQSSSLESLPKVPVGGGTSAAELSTELGTILSFERSGVRYVLAGALPAGPIEALARGL